MLADIRAAVAIIFLLVPCVLGDEGANPKKDVDPVRHFTNLVKLLEEIEDDADLGKVEGELRKWGKPVFDLMIDDPDLAADWSADPKVGPLLKRMEEQSNRLNKIDLDLADRVGAAMISEEGVRRVSEKLDHAEMELDVAYAEMQCLRLQLAFEAYRDEYARDPLKGEGKVDLVILLSHEAGKALTGQDEGKNPKGLIFIEPSWGGERKLAYHLDPWGKAFRVGVDRDGDGEVVLPAEYGKNARIEAGVFIDSGGPDGNFETVADNVTSWK